jgi:hypothetical protein
MTCLTGPLFMLRILCHSWFDASFKKASTASSTCLGFAIAF